MASKNYETCKERGKHFSYIGKNNRRQCEKTCTPDLTEEKLQNSYYKHVQELRGIMIREVKKII